MWGCFFKFHPEPLCVNLMFARNGGEVRVTQASRDGGVDAIILDPDPLRGGKIVVQAKHNLRLWA